jgi:type I restriction enzyme, S subunit
MGPFLLKDLEAQGLITLGRGQIISKNEMTANPGDYPVYSSSATGDGEFGRYGKYMFDDERVTWSIDGGGRPFHRVNLKYSVTNVGGWIKVNKSNLLNTKYLYYSLLGQWKNLVFDYTFKAHPSVIRGLYKINLVSLSEQQSIVATLDKINELIDANKRQLELLDEAVKARFVEMFGDPELLTKSKANTKINEIAECFAGATPSTAVKEFWDNGTIPWMSSGEVNLGKNILYRKENYSIGIR